jgi:hypothetical protein
MVRMMLIPTEQASPPTRRIKERQTMGPFPADYESAQEPARPPASRIAMPEPKP